MFNSIGSAYTFQWMYFIPVFQIIILNWFLVTIGLHYYNNYSFKTKPYFQSDTRIVLFKSSWVLSLDSMRQCLHQVTRMTSPSSNALEKHPAKTRRYSILKCQLTQSRLDKINSIGPNAIWSCGLSGMTQSNGEIKWPHGGPAVTTEVRSLPTLRYYFCYVLTVIVLGCGPTLATSGQGAISISFCLVEQSCLSCRAPQPDLYSPSGGNDHHKGEDNANHSMFLRTESKSLCDQHTIHWTCYFNEA